MDGQDKAVGRGEKPGQSPGKSGYEKKDEGWVGIADDLTSGRAELHPSVCLSLSLHSYTGLYIYILYIENVHSGNLKS